MEVITISAFGAPEVLTASTLPDLHPMHGQVRVAVEAIGVGY